VDISSLTLTGEEKGIITAIYPVTYRSGQGASGSKLRRIAITTSRIRVFDRTRLSRPINPRLGKDWMKWPFTNEGPGSPVSPGSSGTTVAPSGPLLLRGTISTVSLLSLRFLPSSETTNTQ